MFHALVFIMNPGKMVPGKMTPGKNGPRKNGPPKIGPPKIGPRKNGLRKIGSRKIGPRETQKRKIVGRASSIVVCVWNIGIWSIYENPKLDHKPITRKQIQNTETKNHWVSVEHRGVCVECSDVIILWKPKTRQRTQNSETKPKPETKNRGVGVGHRVVYVCVCVMFGCDQSMKTQNPTTNLPGLL